MFSTVRDHGWNWKRSDGTRRVLRKGKDDLTTYLTRSYTLATSADICGYQPSGNHFIAHWPLADQVQTLADLRILWTWYARDDQKPFVKKLVMRRGGIFRTVQHRNRALVLYQPKENITYNAGQVLNTDALRLAFVLSAFRPLEELWIGDQRVDLTNLPFAHPRVEPMFLSDGNVYAAVLPLEVTDLGRDAAVRVTFNEEYKQVTVAYYNYRGTKREFGWEELPWIRNGFAFEIAGKDEYADLAAFRALLANAKVTDVMQQDVRTATFSSADTTLKLSYNPVVAGSETRFIPYKRGDTAFITRQINGQEIDHSYFRSTCAILSPEAKITLGTATLTHEPKVPAWLIKDPTGENYAVWNFSGEVVSLDLQTPQGKVSVKRFHLGRLLLRGGEEPVLEVEELPDGKAVIVPSREWRDLQVRRVGTPRT